MAHEFRLPDIGEGLTEAVVISWYVSVGDPVGLDEPLVEVETDKAVVDIPAPHAGVLLHQGAAAGETIEVDALLAVVGEQGEVWIPAAPQPPGSAAPIVGTLAEPTPVAGSGHSGVEALPRVRKLAAELGVDLGTVTGTGRGGRTTEDDVQAAHVPGRGPLDRVKMTPLRRSIVHNLARAWAEIPHVTTFGEVDAAPLLTRRAELGEPPLEALLIAAIAPLLQRHPEFNAAVVGDEIHYRRYYDIGFAVDTPQGLMVAVIRDADGRDIHDLGTEVKRLAGAARERTATADELRGQTFTISNIGAVGGRYGTPIVPLGTSAILSVGHADERPVVRDGAVRVGREFPLSLSYDHRAIDGAAGRAFMAAVIEALAAT